jgi:hypothetical protein
MPSLFRHLRFFAFTGILIPFVVTSGIAQAIAPEGAVVLKTDALRAGPSAKTKIVAAVKPGTKLIVRPALTAPGWYAVTILGRPPVEGFLRGESMKFLDGISVPGPNKKPVAAQSKPNYCKGGIFCPDIEDIFLLLADNAEKLTKGKFEKTVDWERRRANLGKEFQIGGSHNLSEKLYIFYDYLPRSPVPTEWEYDADKEIWQIGFEVRPQIADACIPVLSPASATELCLYIPRSQAPSRPVTIKMSPSEAAVNDKKIQLAFGGRVVEPYRASMGVHFSLEDIVAINPETGKIWKVHSSPPLLAADSDIPKSPQILSTPESPALSKVESLKRDLIKRPDNAEAFYLMGSELLRGEKFSEAIEAFTVAMDWKPGYSSAQVGLARAHLAAGNIDEALKNIDRVLASDANNAEATAIRESIAPRPSATPVVKAVVKRSLEGLWDLSLQSGQQSVPVTLYVSKKKSKFEGQLSRLNTTLSNSFEIRTGPADSIQFEAKVSLDYFRTAKIKFTGTFDGLSLTGQGIVQSGRSVETITIKSVP